MHINKVLIANATALTTGAVWILCAFAVSLFPSWAYQINLWWTHGLYASPMGDLKVTFISFIMGGATLTIFFWIIGYLFGLSFEVLVKKRR